MKRERSVLDTNVLISDALSSTSTPTLALERAIGDGQLLASSATLRELMEKLLSAKFDTYVSRDKRDALLLRLAPPVEIVEVVQTIRASRDPKDDKFLEVALSGDDCKKGWRRRPSLGKAVKDLGVGPRLNHPLVCSNYHI